MAIRFSLEERRLLPLVFDSLISAHTNLSKMSKSIPYGTWPSPLSAAVLAKAGSTPVRLAGGSAGTLWWTETRPEEKGRVALVKRDGDGNHDVQLPENFSVRSRVHEYGGGELWSGPDGLYFINDSDQRLYLLSSTGPPSPLTPGGRSWRFADGTCQPDTGWLVCVREDHEPDGSGSAEPKNELVAIDQASGLNREPLVIHSGPDFVSGPRFSADGAWLCWVQWNHPNMPWDATELHVAPVEVRNGELSLGASGGHLQEIEPFW